MLILRAGQGMAIFMVIRRRWHCALLLHLLLLVAVGICLEVRLSVGRLLPWWFSAAEYLNRVQIVKPGLNC